MNATNKRWRRVTFTSLMLVILGFGLNQITTLTTASKPNELDSIVIEDLSVQLAGGKDLRASGCTSEGEPTPFERFFLGPTVDGLNLEAAIRRCVPTENRAAVQENFISYLYGSCEATGKETEGVCAPPIGIQTWPVCERSLASNELLPGVSMPHSQIETLGQAKVVRFDEGSRAEIYSADATAVIFGSDPKQVDIALRSLQSEDPSAPVNEIRIAAD